MFVWVVLEDFFNHCPFLVECFGVEGRESPVKHRARRVSTGGEGPTSVLCTVFTLAGEVAGVA